MQDEKEYSLSRGLSYSSLSGVIVPLCLALYFLLSSHSEWEAFGAGMLAVGFLLIGPFAGFLGSAIVAGLFYVPLYLASHRIAALPKFLLPVAGCVIGLIAAVILRMRSDNLILPVYFILAFWGALGGFLFVFGAERRKSA